MFCLSIYLIFFSSVSGNTGDFTNFPRSQYGHFQINSSYNRYDDSKFKLIFMYPHLDANMYLTNKIFGNQILLKFIHENVLYLYEFKNNEILI